MPDVTNVFRFHYNRTDDYWQCRINDIVRKQLTAVTMGWTQGWWMPVQGETHGYHVQIGELYPAKLTFTEMTYRQTTSTTWQTLNLGGVNSPDWPYDVEEPQAGKMRVWTYDH